MTETVLMERKRWSMDRAHVITIILTIIMMMAGAGLFIANSIVTAATWKQSAEDNNKAIQNEIDRINDHLRYEDQMQTKSNETQLQQAQAIQKMETDIEWLKKNSPHARYAPDDYRTPQSHLHDWLTAGRRLPQLSRIPQLPQ